MALGNHQQRSPINSQGFHSGAITNASFGTLDLSLVENGAYLLTLIARGGGDESTASQLINVDSNLKIGQFSFSEQDLVLPVNGIPLTVTRTYNSLNAGRAGTPLHADFGPGSTLSLNSMDVQLDDTRQDVAIGSPEAPSADSEEDENGLPKVVSIRTGGGWDVTVNLPDGRRTTFAFDPLIGSFGAQARWTPPPDVHATLKPIDSDQIYFFPTLSWASGAGIPLSITTIFRAGFCKLRDGTQYYITRGAANNLTWISDPGSAPIQVKAYGPPQLTSILLRTRDQIQISDSGVAHYAPDATNATRSVFFDRDSQNRIVAIYDPNSGSSGLAVVRYIYHADTGNLLQVLKLQDRSTGLYATNRYHYDKPQ